jgi:hypothetical protein
MNGRWRRVSCLSISTRSGPVPQPMPTQAGTTPAGPTTASPAGAKATVHPDKRAPGPLSKIPPQLVTEAARHAALAGRGSWLAPLEITDEAMLRSIPFTRTSKPRHLNMTFMQYMEVLEWPVSRCPLTGPASRDRQTGPDPGRATLDPAAIGGRWGGLAEAGGELHRQAWPAAAGDRPTGRPGGRGSHAGAKVDSGDRAEPGNLRNSHRRSPSGSPVTG